MFQGVNRFVILIVFLLEYIGLWNLFKSEIEQPSTLETVLDTGPGTLDKLFNLSVSRFLSLNKWGCYLSDSISQGVGMITNNAVINICMYVYSYNKYLLSSY